MATKGKDGFDHEVFAHLFIRDIDNSDSDGEYEGCGYLFIFAVVVGFLIVLCKTWFRIVSHVANNYLIPKYYCFWVDSTWCKVISEFAFFFLILFVISLIFRLFDWLFSLDISLFVAWIVSLILFVVGVFVIGRFAKLPIYSNEAMHLKWNKTTYVLQTDRKTEKGEILPEGTLFLPISTTKNEYTAQCKAVVYLDNQLQPITFQYAYEDILKVDDVTISNAFKTLIIETYNRFQELFFERLKENNLYPEKHDINDAFFKQDLTNSGGVINEDMFFGSFTKTEEEFYYFNSKDDFNAFKKIYEETVKDYNISCFDITSRVSYNGLSCYGI